MAHKTGNKILSFFRVMKIKSDSFRRANSNASTKVPNYHPLTPSNRNSFRLPPMTNNTELAAQEYQHEHRRFKRLNNNLARTIDEYDFKKNHLKNLQLINENLKNRLANKEDHDSYIVENNQKIEQGFIDMTVSLTRQRDELLKRRNDLIPICREESVIKENLKMECARLVGRLLTLQCTA